MTSIMTRIARLLIAATFAAGFLFLQSCGGSGNNSGTVGEPVLLTGIAATGAHIRGVVSLQDAVTGARFATHTDDGSYTFNVTGLPGPFLLRVEPDNGDRTLYALALNAGGAVRANINPLTDRMLIAAAIARDHTALDPGHVFDNPAAIVSLTAGEIATVRQRVMQRASPDLRAVLVDLELDVATIDPVRDEFVLGQGLDLALDRFQFRYDSETGNAWEISATTQTVAGGQDLRVAEALPLSVRIAAEQTYLVPGSSIPLSAHVAWSGTAGETQVRGVRWQSSDPALATVDAHGMLTAALFTGTHTVTITCHFLLGDHEVQATRLFNLAPMPSSFDLDMRRLPEHFSALGRYPLFVTLAAQPSGELSDIYGGDWQLVNPDAVTQASVRIEADGDGNAFLVVEKPDSDLRVTLRATVDVNGEALVRERTVTVHALVLEARSLHLECHGPFAFEVPVNCSAFAVFNDGISRSVTPSLSVAPSAEDSLSISGMTVTSVWNSEPNSGWQTVELRADYAGLTTTENISLPSRERAVTSLEVVGVTSIPEGTSTALQVWANWDDGSRSDVTSAVRWQTPDENLASIAANGTFTARYILAGTADRTLTVTAQHCRLQFMRADACFERDIVETAVSVTIRYRAPRMLGIDFDTVDRHDGFVVANSAQLLAAEVIWDKNLPSGAALRTPLLSGVSWTSDQPAHVISGNTLNAGAPGTEPLLLVTAQYPDPANTAIVHQKRRVFTLYVPASGVEYISDGGSYLQGGDGRARPIRRDSANLTFVVDAPERFIADVRQAYMPAGGQNDPLYLRNDGTVWRSVPLHVAGLSSNVFQTLTSMDVRRVPQRIAGLNSVSDVRSVRAYVDYVTINGTERNRYFDFVALRSVGTVWLYSSLSDTACVCRLSDITDVVQIAVAGTTILALKSDGSVWAYGRSSAMGQGTATVPGNRFLRVKSAGHASGFLEGITSLTSGNSWAIALDSSGVAWGWGSNSAGQLGLGDPYERARAYPVTAIADITRLSVVGMNSVLALRNDGSVWAWGENIADEPQRVDSLAGFDAIAGNFLIRDQAVWHFNNAVDVSGHVSPALVGGAGAGPVQQLQLQ